MSKVVREDEAETLAEVVAVVEFGVVEGGKDGEV